MPRITQFVPSVALAVARRRDSASSSSRTSAAVSTLRPRWPDRSSTCSSAARRSTGVTDCGRRTIPWWAGKRAAAAAFAARRVPNTKPSLPFAAYRGTYADSAFGAMTVREEHGGLSFDFGPMRRGTLEHWHFDTFRSHASNPALEDGTFQFHLDPTGGVAEVRVDFGVGRATLKKVPASSQALVGR